MSATRGDLHRSVVISLDQLVDLNGSADEHLTPDAHHVDAGQFVVQQERMRYLAAAVQALPERLRVVVEQYFLGERPMAEIAGELGVTESRVSQLRAEALVLLRDGMNTHLDPERVVEPERPDGVVARRRSAYYAKVAAFAAASSAVPAQRPVPATDVRSDVSHDVTDEKPYRKSLIPVCRPDDQRVTAHGRALGPHHGGVSSWVFASTRTSRRRTRTATCRSPTAR